MNVSIMNSDQKDNSIIFQDYGLQQCQNAKRRLVENKTGYMADVDGNTVFIN